MSFLKTACFRLPREEMALVGPIVRNDQFFFVTIVALAALMVLFEVKRRAAGCRLPILRPSAAKPCGARGARTLWMVSVYASSFLFIVMVTAEFIYAKSVNALSPGDRSDFHKWQSSAIP